MNIIEKSLKAGLARTDITPQLGVRLGGYGVKERPAEEILDRLHSRTLVLEQNGLKAAIINLDWICIEEDIVDCIRAGINKTTGIPDKNISVCTTHNHSVPNTLNLWGWGERENEYTKDMCPETLDILSRSINIGIPYDMKKKEVRDFAKKLIS